MYVKFFPWVLHLTMARLEGSQWPNMASCSRPEKHQQEWVSLFGDWVTPANLHSFEVTPQVWKCRAKRRPWETWKRLPFALESLPDLAPSLTQAALSSRHQQPCTLTFPCLGSKQTSSLQEYISQRAWLRYSYFQEKKPKIQQQKKSLDSGIQNNKLTETLTWDQ